jgi:hypothetical protein
MKTTSGARTWYSLAEFPQRASVSVTRAKPLPITRTKERFGVFKEGLHHGVWAVRVIRDHGASYPSGDHPRLDLRGYKRILQALLDAGRGRDPGPSLCYAVFNIGKKTGKLLGSARFGYFHL